ncbi:MAG: phage holin family protein [Burkholderiales bacterium]
MATAGSGPDPAPSSGLLTSLRNLAATLIAAVQTRLELLATEVEEERLRLLQLMLGGALAIGFSALGVLMLTLAVVFLFWDTHRVLVTTLFAVFYLGIGIALWFVVAGRARARSRLFSTSIAEMAKDRQQLVETDVQRRTD